MRWLLYTNVQNKTLYRGAITFARSQQSQHQHIVSKPFPWLETFPQYLVGRRLEQKCPGWQIQDKHTQENIKTI